MQDNGSTYAENISNFVGQGTVASLELIRTLIEILNMKHTEDQTAIKALKVLEKHVRDGEKLMADLTDPMEAEMYRRHLLRQNVTFSEISVRDKSADEDRRLFITCDMDQTKVDAAREAYMQELSRQTQEQRRKTAPTISHGM